MAGAIAHRGPDGTGVYRDGDVALVNTRLSIVDLAGGDQPISNEDGRYWVLQNGEIYNHPELRTELEGLGHRFRTDCDTEVIVHAYEQWGKGCLGRFNGAFAIALFDRRERELFLARDRFGIRPLFLAEQPGILLFASEAKAILAHPAAHRECDLAALTEVLTLWATLPDRSLFRGVRELAPGHYARVRGGRLVEEAPWWRLPWLEAASERREPEAELAEELRELFRDAVRLRLRADVPVGVYLSGGLDSSATAAAVRGLTSQTLRSFAVRFADPRFDEGSQQEQMAAALGTRLTGVHVDAPDIAARFPDVMWHGEKPMMRTAPAPLLALSAHVREQRFKVVLTGEGADEIFAGYNIFREDKVRRFWARHPDSSQRPELLKRLYPYLAANLGKTGGFARAFFGQKLTETEHPLYSHLIRFSNTARITRLLSDEAKEQASLMEPPEERLIALLPRDMSRLSPLKRAQYLEVTTFLQGYLLHSQGDRMLMGNAVEGRFPFLDHRLAEFAARVPDRLLLRGLREKHLLRQAMAPLLPGDIVRRSKQPYRAPILKAFIGEGAPDYLAELLSPRSLAAASAFSPPAVERLLTKARRSLERGASELDEMALVAVVSTMLLHQDFIAKPRGTRPAIPTREVVGDQVVLGPPGS